MTTATTQRDGTIALNTPAGDWTLDLDDLLDARLPATLNEHLETCPAEEARHLLETLADTVEAEVRRILLNRKLAEQLAKHLPDATITANGVRITAPDQTDHQQPQTQESETDHETQ